MTSKSQAMIPEKQFCTFSLFSSHDLVISPFGNAPRSFVCNGSELQRSVVFWHSKCELLAEFALVILSLKRIIVRKLFTLHLFDIFFFFFFTFLRGKIHVVLPPQG